MRRPISTQVIGNDYDELVKYLKQEGITFAEWLKHQIKDFLKKIKNDGKSDN